MESIEERGYAIAEEVLTPAECDALLEALFAGGVSRSRAGARHLFALPRIAALARDARLVQLASDVLGQAAIPFRVTLFDKSRGANWSVVWHQDTALPLRARFDREGWGPWSRKGGTLYAHAPAAALARVIALRVHLDASTAANDPLRVLPGSHRLGVLSDEEVARSARSIAADDCHVPRGGVLAMRPLLVHSSPRMTNAAPRRVLHVEYADSLELAPGIELAVV